MPHQCTNCGHTFPDGSKEMLSGCPDCGGNKFQFRPDGVPDDESPDPEVEPPEPDDDGVASTVGKAAASVRDLVGSGPEAGADAGAGADVDVDADAELDREDTAQASARSDMVERRDLPTPEERDEVDDARPESDESAEADDVQATAEAESAAGATADEDSADNDDRPDMDELREELNDQFESIRIVAPGQYELNLMELYDREEYIIALQENGRYVIEVPDTWDGPDR